MYRSLRQENNFEQVIAEKNKNQKSSKNKSFALGLQPCSAWNSDPSRKGLKGVLGLTQPVNYESQFHKHESSTLGTNGLYLTNVSSLFQALGQ